MRAVQITEFGGPEVLNVVDLPDPTPGDGQQLFEVSAAGVNFADTHQCQSLNSADIVVDPERQDDADKDLTGVVSLATRRRKRLEARNRVGP